jgi:hypothetical protein
MRQLASQVWIASSIALFTVIFMSLAVGAGDAVAMHPQPTPTPTALGVNAQAVGTLDPARSFRLPAQQIAGLSGGQVAGGGFTFDNFRGSPLDIPWTIYNGPDPATLSIIAQQTTSYFHQIFTPAVGPFFQTCIDNNTSVVISYQMQQSELS